jgi:thiosulfate/3-mercaptopyruvate sulfurtransferase
MGYKYPEVLVSTQWVQDHLNDQNVRIIEVDYDRRSNYDLGHIRNAILLDWKYDMNDPIARNVVSEDACEKLLQKIGANENTILVLYGDFNNWFDFFAFWVFKYYGYNDVRIMNGGRKKWISEDRPLTKDLPLQYAKGAYRASNPNNKIRASVDHVKKSLSSNDTRKLVDVRRPKEFSGEILAPPGYPTDHAQRGGHIPGAVNIPGTQVVNDADGTFKLADQLRQLYESKDVTPDKEIIAYCTIGERSSHTWFVLKYLLGYPNVKNYDGSWIEWGNMIANPIERGSG